jgi:hypothetical protein
MCGKISSVCGKDLKYLFVVPGMNLLTAAYLASLWHTELLSCWLSLRHRSLACRRRSINVNLYLYQIK